MTDKKPIKTEYAGTVFRSKSEAMFARWIDIGPLNRKWIYEPDFLKVGDYVPDFLMWGIGESPHRTEHIVAEVVEYKPSLPTSSYINRLELIYPEIERLVAQKQSPVSFSFDIAVGSVWNDVRCHFRRTKSTRKFRRIDYDWLGEYINQIKSYRFDLQH